MFGNNLFNVTSKSINLPTVLNGISKTLGIVNQAIPLYQQAKPMIQKGRSLFKLVNEINKSDSSNKSTFKVTNYSSDNVNTIDNSNNQNINQPVFFQ